MRVEWRCTHRSSVVANVIVALCQGRLDEIPCWHTFSGANIPNCDKHTKYGSGPLYGGFCRCQRANRCATYVYEHPIEDADLNLYEIVRARTMLPATPDNGN